MSAAGEVSVGRGIDAERGVEAAEGRVGASADQDRPQSVVIPAPVLLAVSVVKFWCQDRVRVARAAQELGLHVMWLELVVAVLEGFEERVAC